MKKNNNILIVDDNSADALLMKEAFALCGVNDGIHIVEDGFRALEFLRNKNATDLSSLPDLILLDLNMPKRNGLEVLKELKTDPVFGLIPIIIFSSSTSLGDIKAAYEHHASAYLQKPEDFESSINIARSIKEFWLAVVLLYKKKS